MDKNQKEPNEPRVVLTGLHFTAIELRYNGAKYKEITKELFERHGKYVLEGRIKKWFMKGGILFDTYAEYSRQETEERKELMHQQLRKLGMKLPMVLEETLYRPARNPFTGEVIKENGQIVYIRDRTSNEAVKIVAQLLGAKFADDGAEQVGNALDTYFKRLENFKLPAKQGEPVKEHATP